MREAVILIALDGRPIIRRQSDGRTAASIPDDGDHWRAIWENRARLAGTAHLHPPGCPRPSQEDRTTFEAIEKALGRRLDWWIISGDDVTVTHRFVENGGWWTFPVYGFVPWIETLRQLGNEEDIVGAEVEFKRFVHVKIGDGHATLAVGVENDVLVVSRALCSPKDQFCRRTGRKIAQHRLVHKDAVRYRTLRPYREDVSLVEQAVAAIEEDRRGNQAWPRWTQGEKLEAVGKNADVPNA